MGHCTRLSPNVHICDLMVCPWVPLKTLKRLAFTKRDSFKLRESDIWIKEKRRSVRTEKSSNKMVYVYCYKKSLNVTLFGKTRLNENSVEPFFHFNAF